MHYKQYIPHYSLGFINVFYCHLIDIIMRACLKLVLIHDTPYTTLYKTNTPQL